jgi:hypothetical protein
MECAHALLGYQVIVGVLLQFRNKLGPIRRERKLARSGIGAARSHARHIDKNDRQTSLSESAREPGSPADDFAGRVHGRNPATPFCKSITIKAELSSSLVRGMSLSSGQRSGELPP